MDNKKIVLINKQSYGENTIANEDIKPVATKKFYFMLSTDRKVKKKSFKTKLCIEKGML